MPFLILDDDNNITRFIMVGNKPEGQKSVEIQSIPPDIMSHLFDYRYEDGRYVLKSETNDSHLETAKTAKIAFLSETCQSMIESGIDFNGEHYSLQSTDQINLSKLGSIAMVSPTTPLFYHSDGNLCRQYSVEEILALSQLAVEWITYHTTYFNYAKAYINALQRFDDVASFHYGMKFDEVHQSGFDAIVSQFNIKFEQVIVDPNNYDEIKHPLKYAGVDFVSATNL